MVKTSQKAAADYINPLYINGLHGRLMQLPAPGRKKRHILFIYGHHSTLERTWGIADDLNQYGEVTVPDLPGFGGMDSFYRIGKKPTLDNLADYLASFVKLRYRRKRLTIIGFSFGFVVATRMLQRYPDLAQKVDLLVSAVGFAHKDDFTFTRARYNFYLWMSRLFSFRIPALIFRHVALNSLVIRLAYSKTKNAKEKFAGLNKAEHRAIMNFEIGLWQRNDVRTHMSTSVSFLTLDNCQQKVDLPVWHVAVDGDRYFDNHRVEQHMRVIFNDFNIVHSHIKNHGPSVILDKEAAKPFTPPEIRKLLSKRS